MSGNDGRQLTVIGLDVGGTSSRGRLVRGDDVLAEAKAKTASISTSGLDAALSTLTTLLRDVTSQAGVDAVDAVCLGTAGSGSESADAKLRGTVDAAVHTKQVAVVNDAELLLPAAGHVDGVAVVSGTGMKIFAQYDGRQAFAGGWGFLLGDEGSGYWITREAIRVVLDRIDSGSPIGELGAALYETLHIHSGEELIEQFHASPAPGEWARHVPAVLAAEDPARSALLDEGGAQLARRALQALARLDAPNELPVVCAGGVLTNFSGLVDALAKHLHEERPQLRVEVLTEPPVAGAVNLARRACANQSSSVSG